eukprot:COSAG02_NODE_4448_length_5345_cov_5.091689_2_plen_63_part_00
MPTFLDLAIDASGFVATTMMQCQRDSFGSVDSEDFGSEDDSADAMLMSDGEDTTTDVGGQLS